MLAELADLGDELRHGRRGVERPLRAVRGVPRALRSGAGRAVNGEPAWVTRPRVDSCHTVWMELHEDLLATLGIDRGGERAHRGDGSASRARRPSFEAGRRAPGERSTHWERMADVPLYRDEAVVLRTHPLGEADRIITLLTKERGRIRAVAKGVRRTKSRFGARLEPFMVVDVQCYEGRNLDTVTQAESLATYGQTIARDYTVYTAATVMVETAEQAHRGARAVHAAVPAPRPAPSGRSAAGEHDPALVLDAYLLRSLAVAGWAPSFHDCAKCGAPGPHSAFNIAAGGAVCPVCRPPGSAAPAPETLRLLAALLSGRLGDRRRLRACASAGRAAGWSTAFLQWHLERGVRSLRHVERLAQG